MKQMLEEILKAFQKSKAKYLKIDLGWRKHLELEKSNTEEGEIYYSSQTVSDKISPLDSNDKEQINKEEKSLSGEAVRSFFVGKFKATKQNLIAGEPVKKNEVLGFVESMGIAHEIVAPFNGVIEEVCIENGGIVEYEQILFYIKEEK